MRLAKTTTCTGIYSTVVDPIGRNDPAELKISRTWNLIGALASSFDNGYTSLHVGSGRSTSIDD